MSSSSSANAPASTPAKQPAQQPDGATAVLVLSSGHVIWGRGIGAAGTTVGEVCFNTSITGYQEILTDPSYAGQIITFTFPHVGNVGANLEDIETTTPASRGLVLRADITQPSSWRAAQPLDAWLKSYNLIGIAGVDTRRLTRLIRDAGAPTGVLCHAPDGKFDLDALKKAAAEWPGLEGMDLAKEVTCRQTYGWDETLWSTAQAISKIAAAGGNGTGNDTGADEPKAGYGRQTAPTRRVVAIDYGAKRNILRSLASAGCKVTVVPATATAEDVLRHEPDGVFLSNGPGDPAATGEYAVPTIRKVMETGVPVFGICLGHQLLALALGAKTRKMHQGHRGANHPVKDLITGKVEITSQNHGFVVDEDTLPAGVTKSHVSLFDGSLEGLRVDGKPVFSVQYHPEASPGPQDAHYLFDRFMDAMDGK